MLVRRRRRRRKLNFSVYLFKQFHDTVLQCLHSAGIPQVDRYHSSVR